MNCPSCGSQQVSGTAACTQCGAPLPAPPAQQPQQQDFPQHPQQGHPPHQQGYAPPPQPGYPPQEGYGAGPYGYPPPEGYAVGPATTSGMAIAGFVLSFFCSLLGLIFSSIALSEINKSDGQVGGKGLAIAGLVISIVSIFLALAIVAAGS